MIGGRGCFRKLLIILIPLICYELGITIKIIFITRHKNTFILRKTKNQWIDVFCFLDLYSHIEQGDRWEHRGFENIRRLAWLLSYHMLFHWNVSSFLIIIDMTHSLIFFEMSLTINNTIYCIALSIKSYMLIIVGSLGVCIYLFVELLF